MTTKNEKAKPLNKFQAYEKRQLDKGLTKCTVWVPEGDEVSLKTYADRKRKAHARKLKGK